ncbi:MAG: amylo-alpha-1,6-glucosidase, partial [Thermodesulfobacteriota bacterium]
MADSLVEFGREVCGELRAAEEREWLTTNGLGGFASGTIVGSLTRRYHGLLIAALKPPLGRTVLVSKLDETAHYDGQSCTLFTNRWADGTVDPHGYRHIQPDANTTYVQYRLLRGSRPLELSVKALVNYRDYHSTTHAGDWRMNIEKIGRGLRVTAFDGATPFYLLSSNAEAEPAHDWYRDCALVVERYRGLDDRDDHLHAGTFRATLRAGESVTLVLSTEAKPELDGDAAWRVRQAHEKELLAEWDAANAEAADKAPSWVQQLVLAADQFIVRRPLADNPEALSVIAGYHWFGDWGRDTMIALPGLALTTGRPEVARNILRTFARFVDRGMLPNVFPDAGETPEYNTADATLWYFEAVRQYLAATDDLQLVRELFPVLADIVDWHVRGTRYQIHADAGDGLLYAGEPGVQLTWMDAKVGDWVVTPRIGKPVEINALWYNALATMARVAKALGKRSADYEAQAARVRESFQRFWNTDAGYCFDVLDGPNGNEATLRPNAIFAVSLPESPLTAEQQRAVVDVCARNLLT